RLIEDITECRSKISDLETLNPKNIRYLNQEQLKEKKKEHELFVSSLKKDIARFNEAIKPFSIMDAINSDLQEALKNKIKIHMKEINNQLKMEEDKLLHLAMINVFSEEELKFSERQSVEESISDLKKNIGKYEKIYANISHDLSLVNRHIQDITDNYFNTELINKLYQAIDPHPTYTKIIFECVITDNDKPQLNIRAASSNNESVSPSINFSSAQINVLSLSIFLARALTTTNAEGKPVDCIFIDDPIQSMDSINVLSLIDLFRNISTRLNKQLIISTHDENFHELLKKKIPPGIFKAKYLHLASFGKVAYD
ncbi:MAG: exonuclease SbcC, partial [Kiritimatiellia bacterium]